MVRNNLSRLVAAELHQLMTPLLQLGLRLVLRGGLGRINLVPACLRLVPMDLVQCNELAQARV